MRDSTYTLVTYSDEVREAMGIGADEIAAIGIALDRPADSTLAAFAPSRIDVNEISIVED